MTMQNSNFGIIIPFKKEINRHGRYFGPIFTEISQTNTNYRQMYRLN